MKLAVPNKGRLHDPALSLLDRAGLQIENGADRRLYAETVDPEVSILFVRASDIPEYVADGAADLGITGLDQVRETADDSIVDLLDLEFGHCRVVLAVPEAADITDPADLDGRSVATEFPTITQQYFDELAISVDIVEVSGATELTPHVDMAEAIVDITSTGTTLRMNRLEEIDELLKSSVHLIARDAVADAEKTNQLVMALRSVLAAEGKRYLMMNVPEECLDDIESVLPGLEGPTVMDIAGDSTVAVHAVVDERSVFETINAVKERGASDILVTEIERLVE